MRERSPFFSADGAVVFIGRFSDCERVLTDPTMSSRDVTATVPGDGELRPSFLALDPPDHTRLRRLVSKAFTPRHVAALAARIAQLVDRALDAAAEQGEIDVVADLAQVVPSAVICGWLGVPQEDGPLLRGLTAIATEAMDPYVVAEPDRWAVVQRAQQELEDYFRELTAVRRASPGDDLLSGLIQARDEGNRLSEEELLATVSLLLVAGQDSVGNLISNGALALLRNPTELARLRTDPALAETAVEETLRFDPPVQLASRLVTRSCEVGGVEVTDGTRIMVLLAAAGRDPAVNPAPDEFLLDPRTRRHLAFSVGPHYCFGASLARLQAATVFRKLFTRAVDAELVADSLRYRQHLNLRGPARLVVRFNSMRAAV